MSVLVELTPSAERRLAARAARSIWRWVWSRMMLSGISPTAIVMGAGGMGWEEMEMGRDAREAYRV
jgi:hypothetical protein